MATESLRQRNRRRARREVAEVATALFADQGFDAVSVDQVAEAAGLSRSTVFRYFPVKEDLVMVWHDELVEELDERLARHDHFALEEVTETFVATFTVWADALPDLTALLEREDALQARAAQRSGRVADVIAAHLLRTGLPAERAAITAAAVAGAVQQGRWLTGDGSPRSVRAAVEQVVDVVRCLVPTRLADPDT
jgi:AcrR family transcriptional regulator